MARIQDVEVEKARKLASRKTGVTRQQLASQLGIKLSRAKIILDKSGLPGTSAGAGAGKANRALVYKV